MIKTLKGAVLLILCSMGVLNASAQDEELERLYGVVRTTTDSTEIADTHGLICWRLINKDIVAAQTHMDSARAIYKAQNNLKGIAIADYKDGVINRRKGNYADAIDDIQRYLDYAESQKDQRLIKNGMYQLAVIYEEVGDYTPALEIYLELLDSAQAQNAIKGIGLYQNSIGIIYKNLGNYNEARERYLHSIEVLKDSEYKEDLGNSYGNLATVYGLEGKNEQAVSYALLALESYSSINDQWGKAMSYSNLGELYFNMGDLTQAEHYNRLALAIQEKNEYAEQSVSLVNLGRIFVRKSDPESAANYFKKALDLDPQLDYKAMIHHGLYEYYEEQKDFEQALDHYQKFEQIQDSVAGLETIKDINRLQFKFETARKDKELIAQDLIIKNQENTILTNEAKSTRNLFLGLVALGALVFVLFYFRQRQQLNKKEIESLKVSQALTKLEALIEGEENERQRLAQDLHDGINGDLSVIKYKLTSIDRSKLSAEESKDHATAVSMLDHAIEQVRSISHDLAPPSLKEYNIVEAIGQYCLKVSSGSKIKIDFQHYGERMDLPVDKETALYRITQELLNNSIRHSNAKQILVQINFHENAIHVSVQDDGVGYNTEEKGDGIGLSNIRSRAQFLGADLNVESSDKGTLTTVDVTL